MAHEIQGNHTGDLRYPAHQSLLIPDTDLQDPLHALPGDTAAANLHPGSVLFDHAICQTKLALRSSVLRGILWHQGENDCVSDDLVDEYKEKFITMITALRKELGAERVPVIIGELSENISDEYNLGTRPTRLNKIFYEIADEIECCKVVSAKGLSLRDDGIHFNSQSYQIFGKRYFEEYISM